jgi:uncharacterized membrane protein
MYSFLFFLFVYFSDGPTSRGDSGGIPGGAAWLVVAIILLVAMVVVSTTLVCLLIRWRNNSRRDGGRSSTYDTGDIKEVYSYLFMCIIY